MPAYKDEKKGTWYTMFYYVDWMGNHRKKCRRGFKTKREAKAFEAEFKRSANGDMDMTMELL